MKKSILLFYTFIHLTGVNAQNKGIANIKEYYHSINKSEIIENSWGVERLKKRWYRYGYRFISRFFIDNTYSKVR